jgi:hypothetical protein
MRAPHSGVIGHPQPFLSHDKPMILLDCCAAPFGLLTAVFRSSSIFLSLGHRGHFLLLIGPTRSTNVYAAWRFQHFSESIFSTPALRQCLP